ncbi:hypothetical protein SRABI96_00919 [Peribacillus sp. Bi96]|uniref:hypothetical protein n=1 Tax=unclassified Peribacillus TaxID=2675266 RepID=UPI001DA84FAB|nr:hypothetical protein [Peribacillus sp. Bi96]CAH0159484.1 hypothetical protein SRABI96_00919 [Peribacillus sp. Bi96]
METFQREMNHNRDEFRKTRWTQHRKQITGLFDAVFSKKEIVEKVAIVGAGNCDDLDIEYLASKCSSLYLFDIDRGSMEKATNNLPEHTRKKIQLVEIDVTGLDKMKFEDQLTSMLNRGDRAEDIIQYVKEIENRLSQVSDSIFAKYYNGFDIVATSAIYTQLFYNWAIDLLSHFEKQYQENDAEEIKDGFLDLRDQIVRTLNHSVSKCIKEDGFYITWSDILKIEPEYMETINEGLNAIFALASNVGYGAALIGIKDYMEKVDKSELSLRYWPWDFNTNKQYLTIGIIGRLKEGYK